MQNRVDSRYAHCTRAFGSIYLFFRIHSSPSHFVPLAAYVLSLPLLTGYKSNRKSRLQIINKELYSGLRTANESIQRKDVGRRSSPATAQHPYRGTITLKY